jgi:hypothetical protein
VGQHREHVAQHLGGPSDVDQDPVVVQRLAAERRVHDVRRAVQRPGGPEDLAAQAVRDQHVVADRHAEHGTSPGS